MILVTGATGFVGGHLLRRLAASRTAPLSGLVRSPGRGKLPPGVEARVADLDDPAALSRALDGVAIVVHAAAMTANLKEPFAGAYERANRVGTEHLVAAARETGVKRLVLVSGLGTRPAPPGTYMATRWAMEEAVRGSGIPYAILQPSVLFGDGAEFVAALARLARVSPILPVLGGSGLRFQPLWIEDLVTCLERSISDDSLLGREVALGGAEYATFRQVLEAICRALPARRLLLPLPIPVARLQARLMTALLPHPPLTPAALELFDFDNATDLDAVERSFHFQPRGFREHLEAHGLAG